MSNGKINPLAALEFTPALVRLLAENPTRLVKIAESHRRWLLASIHPDRIGHGNEERARLFTEALADLKDDGRRAAAIESFLQEHEGKRSSGVSELRVLREQLERAEERATSCATDLARERTLVAEFMDKTGVRLRQWIERATMHQNFVRLENRDTDEEVSLEGSLLILSSLRTGYANVVVVGNNRSVVYEEEWPKDRLAKLNLLEKPHACERIVSLKLFGSYLDERYGPGSSIVLKSPRGTDDGADLRVLATAMTPKICMGNSIVFSDTRPDGYSILWIKGRLREVKPGTVTILQERRGRKPGTFTWTPAR